MNDWIGLPENYLDFFGFVYIIKNNHPDSIKKYYIGQKKILKKVTRKPLKNTKRKRITYVDNGVMDYWGSSRELQDDIEKFGIEYFTREILHLCTCKWEMTFLETHEQFKSKVLLDKTSYNSIINCRINNCPEKLREKYENYLQ